MEVRGFAFFCVFSTLLMGLVMGSGGCLLFTDDFNKAPQVKIVGPSGTASADGSVSLFRGETKRFSAMVQDEDGAAQLDWGVAEGSCPMTLADADRLRPSSRGDQTTFDLPKIDKAGPSCVYVIVTDRAGARSFGTQKVEVKNRGLVIHPPGRIARNEPAAFTAAFLTDPDGADDVAATQKGTFKWGRDRICADAEKAAMMAMKETSTFNVALAPRRSFCVSVFALDENGISATASVPIADKDIIATGPAAFIRMVAPALAMATTTPAVPLEPLGLFTMVKLSGADPGDVGPDEAGNYKWTLTRPGGATAASTGTDLAFTTESAGHYQIELTITEDGAVATAAPLGFDVIDAPPCIAETEPSQASGTRLVGRYDQPRAFRVISVTDDADPVPAAMRPSLGVFVWATRPAPAETAAQAPALIPFVTRRGSFAELVLPARLYQPGDRVEVRVEYLDRRDLVEARDLSACKDNEPHCGVSGGAKAACVQRITWTVDYLL